MKALYAILVGLLCVACIGLLCENYQLKHPTVLEVYIPSLRKLQSIVGAVPNGIYGAETQIKWDLFYGQQLANVTLNKNTIDNEWGLK